MNVGERIKRRREALNINQTELAQKVSATKQTIYTYENGIVTNIPSDTIELIATTLGVSPAYLMGWDDYEDPIIERFDREFETSMQIIEDAGYSTSLWLHSL